MRLEQMGVGDGPLRARFAPDHVPRYKTMNNTQFVSDHLAHGRHFRGRQSLIGAAIACLAPLCLGAPDTESSFFEELPVVLSASRLPQPLAEAPAAVTVLDREFIRATGYRDLGRLLRLVPGFTVVQDRGHTSAVAYHGLGASFASNKMQVLIDGRSVYSNYLAGGVDWSGLPITIDEIERIEIVRGSNSAAFGSNAFLGVVNIITRDSTLDQGAGVSVRTGNRDLLDGAAHVGFNHGGLSMRLSVEHLQDSGFRGVADDRRSSIATLRADYRLSPQTTIMLQTGSNASRRVYGYADSPLNAERPLESTQGFIQLRARYTVGPDEEWSFGYYHNSERATEVVPAPILALVGLEPRIDYSRRAWRDNVDFQHQFSPAKDWRVVWGAEARHDGVESGLFFAGDPERTTSLARGFGNLEWRATTSLLINAGGMYERYQGKTPKFAPRLFANWEFVPGHTLRAGSAVAYREPSLFEQEGRVLGLNGLGQVVVDTASLGRLNPERVSSYEAGYFGIFPAATTLDVRVFRERVSNLVVFRDGGSGQPDIIDNSPDLVTIRGIEFQLKTKPLRDTELIWSHALTRIESDNDSLRNSMPPYSASLTWLQRYWGGVSSTLTVFSVGPTEWRDSKPVASYVTWDGRLAWRFKAGRADSELAVGLINGGVRHEEWGLPGRPPNPTDRFGYVSVRAEF